jgi:hypothetical protein
VSVVLRIAQTGAMIPRAPFLTGTGDKAISLV